MKLIESSAELILQEPGIEGIYKAIEVAGRTAYNSQDKITPDSAKDFVDRMIKSKHGAALEHGTVYLYYKECCYSQEDIKFIAKYEHNRFSKVIRLGCDDDPWPDGSYHDIMGGTATGDSEYVITTNYRVLIENNWLNDLQYQCSPTEFHEKRYTMRFTCSRAIANELVRHRVFSFLQESTRYINYSKERHGGEITFIKPSWLNCPFEDIPPQSELCYLAKQHPDEAAHRFIASLVESKYAYMTLLQKGCTPQQARDVLPNATKTELIMTGFASDWRHVLDLRLFEKTGAVHPDMKDLMQKAQNAAQEAGIWEDIMSKPSKFE